jgi:peptidoglycan/xylan/chitin deacetylase (PgdA/CDA1 family)
VQVLRLSRVRPLDLSTIRVQMTRIPWTARLSCCALALVGGGSFADASEAAVPFAASTLALRHAPAPMIEPVHAEPGPEVLQEIGRVVGRDAIGSRFPSGLTIHGGSKHRVILFSFDDGPSRRTTPHLLDVLDELGIKAIFFVTSATFGNANPWEREHAKIVREIARRGHVIGNHTETHRQLPLLRDAEIEAELAVSERKIRRAIGTNPRLIRPPGGALSERVERVLTENGYTSVLWALYPGDLEVSTPDDVVRTFFRVLERREQETGERGGIVLLHDTKGHSLEAVPRLVDALEERNCELLANGEELYAIVDDLGYFIPGYEPEESYEDRQETLREEAQRQCGALAAR